MSGGVTSLVASSLATGALWAERLPGPTYESPTEGSPGFAGFVATFALALAVIALGISFTRRMRRASFRDRQREAAAATPPRGEPHADEPPATERQDASGDGSSGSPVPPADPGPR